MLLPRVTNPPPNQADKMSNSYAPRTQANLGAMRPRVGICQSRFDALTNKYMNINTSSIANLGHRTPSWQCRRGDASPPGQDPPPNQADKLQFIAQNLYTFSEPLIYLSCFIFQFQLIEYQSFQKMKHTTLMFHFQFHVSFFKTLRERFHAPSVFFNRSHSVFVFLPQCFQYEIKMRIFNHMPTR